MRARSIVSVLIPMFLMHLCTSANATNVISWSQSSIERVLIPGQSLAMTVTFRTTSSLTNVSLFVVPDLQTVVQAVPNHFSVILPDVRYTVTLLFSAPVAANLGTLLAGTIHLRQGTQTLVNTLKISVEYESASFERPDPSLLFTGRDGTYPLNQVIVILNSGQDIETATELARSIGGAIVGIIPPINAYQFDVPTSSNSDLEALLSTLSSDPRVSIAFKNFEGALFGATDLANLAVCRPDHPEFVQAYNNIHLLDAYNFLSSLQVTFSPVTAGIIDTGIDRRHIEFTGVNTGTQSITSPGDLSLTGHGTSVSGIIGANNLGLVNACVGSNGALQTQMNGLVSGLPIPYSLSLRGFVILFVFDVAADMTILASAGTPIVNLSWGVSASTSTTQLFRAVASQYPNTLFVFAGGENGVDVNTISPANLGGPGAKNIITVAGTNPVNDSRSTLPGPSNWGLNVDIAAPGQNVYAPTVNQSFFSTFPYLIVSLDPGYQLFHGTSASAPMVTGAAAILQALGAGSPANLKYYLTASGDPIPTTDNKPIGGRRLNVFCAVELVLPPPTGLVMDDDFSEGYRDCSRWFTTVEPPGIGLMAVANQELDMTKVSSGNGYMGLASRCKVSGDFDVQVDYKQLTWPAENFHTVRLIASDLPDGGTGFPGVYRNSYADENYQFRNQLGAAGLVSVSTSDTSGTIGLKRTGQTLYGYDSHGTIGSAPTTADPTGFTIDFATPSTTAPGDVAVAFDNFKVNAGNVACQ